MALWPAHHRHDRSVGTPSTRRIVAAVWRAVVQRGLADAGLLQERFPGVVIGPRVDRPVVGLNEHPIAVHGCAAVWRSTSLSGEVVLLVGPGYRRPARDFTSTSLGRSPWGVGRHAQSPASVAMTSLLSTMCASGGHGQPFHPRHTVAAAQTGGHPPRCSPPPRRANTPDEPARNRKSVSRESNQMSLGLLRRGVVRCSIFQEDS